MIDNTFIHLPGVGHDTEARFWAQGIRTWDDLESNLFDITGGGKRASKIAAALAECRAAREAGEFRYFQGRLKGADMWRLLPAFFASGHESKIAYLDIETTGLGFPPSCASTTIAVLFNGKLELEHQFERKRMLMKEVEREAQMLVTFNGSTFDLPFLRREFKLKLDHPHIDLRYWMKAHGFSGGLKKIQAQIPDIPQRDYMDIDGFDAVRLWNLHKRGVPNALETLYTYNAEDTLVLEHLIYTGLNLEAGRHKTLALPEYPMPKQRSIPHEVCPHVYKMIR